MPQTWPLSENVGEVHGHGLGIHRGHHLVTRFHFYQLRAGLANLVVEGIPMALLNDDLVSGQSATSGNPWACGTARYPLSEWRRSRSGAEPRRPSPGPYSPPDTAQFRHQFPGRHFQLINLNKTLVYPPHQLQDVGTISNPPIDGNVPLTLHRRYSRLGVDVASTTKPDSW